MQKKRRKKKIKRGLSTVIITLIVILVSLAAIAILWVVVRKVIQSESEQISIGQFTLDVEIMDVKLDIPSNNVNFTVMRNSGEGEFSNLKFVFYDDRDYEVIIETISLDELEEKKFSLHLNNLSVSKLATVSVIPILNQKGRETIGNVLYEYDLKEETTGIDVWTGLVLWFRCDDDLSDSIAADSSGKGNIGNCSGTAICPVYLSTGGHNESGAYQFDGLNDYLRVNDSKNILDLNDSGTIALWVWVDDIPAGTYTALAIKKYGDYSRPYNLYLNPAEKIYFTLGNSTSTNANADSVTYSVSLNDSSWHHVVGIWNSTNLGLYVDGIKRNEKARTVGSLEINDESLWIGRRTGYFNGSIDEIRIYDRTLTDQEIQNLYILT